MDFSLQPELVELRERTRQFIAEQVIPFEGDARIGTHGPSEALRDELLDKARKAGLLTPHAAVELGGLGLSHTAKAIVFEEAGYSSLGPVAMNIHAPDEGNIHLAQTARGRSYPFLLCDDRARTWCWSRPINADDHCNARG
jgi:acyl-CoA dehydrogenase